MKPYLSKKQESSSELILKEHDYCLKSTKQLIEKDVFKKIEKKSNKRKNLTFLPNSSISKSRRLVHPAISVNNNFYSTLSAQSVNQCIDVLKHPLRWLDDTLINIAQSFLSHQFPEVGGFQSSCIFNSNNFGGYTISAKFVQILNVRNSHWVLISNLTSDNGCNSVQYYDSLFTVPDTVPLLVHRVARSLLINMCISSLNLEVMRCHKQDNGNDCGLYAIANATALCNGFDPSLILWGKNSMRSHFLQCIEKKKNGDVSLHFFIKW
jgi:Ulp1 family protease